MCLFQIVDDSAGESRDDSLWSTMARVDESKCRDVDRKRRTRDEMLDKSQLELKKHKTHRKSASK